MHKYMHYTLEGQALTLLFVVLRLLLGCSRYTEVRTLRFEHLMGHSGSASEVDGHKKVAEHK